MGQAVARLGQATSGQEARLVSKFAYKPHAVVGVRTVALPGAGVAVTSAVKTWLDRNPVLERQTAARVMAGRSRVSPAAAGILTLTNPVTSSASAARVRVPGQGGSDAGHRGYQAPAQGPGGL
jgi:hypothetical protein